MSVQGIIGHILVTSIQDLFITQPNILMSTPLTGMTEWNYSHHLANEISKYLFWLDHDLEVTKHSSGNQRPDIIFHKRGINDLNFLVVEIKTSGSCDEDINKIKRDWMGGELQYRFGASIVVTSQDDFEIRIFGDNEEDIYSSLNSRVNVSIRPDSVERGKLISLTKIVYDTAITEDYRHNENKQQEVKELLLEIDGAMNNLYEINRY